MKNIAEKLAPALREDLKNTIIQATTETVEAFFGCRIDITSEKQNIDNNFIIACVPFRQESEAILLRLAFEKAFIRDLTSAFYSGDFDGSEKDRVDEDAASELANIIGNRVKFFMNAHAFDFDIDLPYIERASTTRSDKVKIIDLNFKMNEGPGLSILSVKLNADA